MATEVLSSPKGPSSQHPNDTQEDPLHWARATTAMAGSHWEELKRMVGEFQEAGTILIEGSTLTVAKVAAVARKPSVTVALDEAAAKSRVNRSSNWVLSNPAKVTANFGAASHRRTNQAEALQTELVRFMTVGVIGTDPANSMDIATTRAAILVRINTLLQGYSGIRWAILRAMQQLLNERVTPRIPLRGSISASGDLVPLAYIAGLLTGREDARAVTGAGREVAAAEALALAGLAEPFVLKPKEGLALLNGTAVGSGLASTVCYDANVLTLFAEVSTALFCEAMLGDKDFTDNLTHRLKHHPGQIEAAAIMEWILEGSALLVRKKGKKTDRYALRSAPQWLGPQIEVVRTATHAVEREINSVNDNPLIDVSRDKTLQGGNFQATAIGTSMDNLRLAMAAIGKLMFAQMTELVSDFCNGGLPANLTGGPDPSLDYGLKGAEIAMAAYTSELLYLANPVTTHVQSAEQHNQDVNSLGLISARKTAEAMEILKLMCATFLVALAQAVDLRHLEEIMQASVRAVVSRAATETLFAAGDGGSSFPSSHSGCEKDLLQVVEDQPPFSYIDDASCASYPLMQKLRQVLVQHAMDESDPDHERSSSSVFGRIKAFEEKVRAQLEATVPEVRRQFHTGVEPAIPNRIADCRSFPLYRFVRSLGTKLLLGTQTRAPGQDIELVYQAISHGQLAAPLLECLHGWTGVPAC